jgi:hypothetical protein
MNWVLMSEYSQTSMNKSKQDYFFNTLLKIKLLYNHSQNKTENNFSPYSRYVHKTLPICTQVSKSLCRENCRKSLETT